MKSQVIHQQLNLLASHLDSVNEIFRLKLIWLFVISPQCDRTFFFDPNFTDPNYNPPKRVIEIRTTNTALRPLYDPFLTEIRRSYLNDLYLVTSRQLIIVRNILDNKIPPEPEFNNNTYDGAICLLNRYVSKQDAAFLKFFRQIRNSVVHYDGNHNARNKLDFVYRGRSFETSTNDIGSQIQFSISDLIGFYEELRRIFDFSNLSQNPAFLR